MAPKKIQTIKIVLSLLNTEGGLFNIKNTTASREVALKNVCPACHASLMSQLYKCDNGCKPDPGTTTFDEGWKAGEIVDRCRVEGTRTSKKLIVVTAEEIAATKAVEQDLKPSLELAVYPADQVEKATWPGGTTYAFIPDKADEVYALLLEGTKDASKAFVGILNLRSTEKLYRVIAHEGAIRLQELLAPEDVAEFDPVALPSIDASKTAMFASFVSAVEDDFDPSAYTSTKREAMKALLDSKTGGTPIAPTKATTKPAATVNDQLLAALTMAQATKAARKKTA